MTKVNKVWQWLMKQYGLFSLVLWCLWWVIIFAPVPDNWWIYIAIVWNTQFYTRWYYTRVRDMFGY